MFNPTNEITVNQQAINQHAPKYIESYIKTFGEPPLHWWGFPFWFQRITGLKMCSEDVLYSIKVLGME